MNARHHHTRRLPYQRLGAVAVWVAVSIPVIAGFTALGIDMSRLHSVKNDLQRAADAAALAAAQALATADQDMLHEELLAVAQDMADRNLVAGEVVELTLGDLILGQATFDGTTGRYTWLGEAEDMPNGVQVTLRRTDNSPSGAVDLYFGVLVGKDQANLTATARAVLIPRDLALVCDLSGSMNDDSELRHSRITEINLSAIWLALGTPTFGLMTTWGDEIVLDVYDPTSDAGLLYLKRYETCTSVAVHANLSAREYSEEEIDALMGTYYDDQSSSYKNRFKVILGLADWKSGKPGGKYGDGSGTGNGNNWIGNSELTNKLAFPYPTGASHGKWDSYMSYPQGGSEMKNADSRLRYRYGLKTFVNYLLEKRSNYSQTPVLWQTPEQPLQAVKDAVGEIVNIITGVDSGDQLSLEIYAQTSRHEVDLTRTFTVPYDTLVQRQSNHYDNTTCIGCGIAEAHAELLTERARPGAAKVMILLTDGIANTIANGEWDVPGAKIYAEEEAVLAADSNITIYTVGVGSSADMDLMEDIAEIGHGTSFHAVGTVEEYSEQLREIFRTLGSKRPAILIY